MVLRETIHSKHDLKYHFVWCPKYRKVTLSGNIGKYTAKLIYEVSERYDFNCIQSHQACLVVLLGRRTIFFHATSFGIKGGFIYLLTFNSNRYWLHFSLECSNANKLKTKGLILFMLYLSNNPISFFIIDTLWFLLK